MASYNTNSPMKKKIIEVATPLFYENGYSNTTIEQIASYCNASKGLVHYHFPSKENIAFDIYDNITNECKTLVQSKMAAKFCEYDPIIAQAVIDRLTLRHLKEDSKFFQFFKETSPLRIGKRSDGFHHYEQLTQNSSLLINYQVHEIQLIAAASQGAVTSLIISYFDGNIDCCYDEFEDYRIEYRFKLLGTDKENIKQIIRESKQLYEEFDFKILTYFHVE